METNNPPGMTQQVASGLYRSLPVQQNASPTTGQTVNVTATASVGYPTAVGAELRYDGRNIDKLQLVAQTGTSTVNVLYLGAP